MTRNYEKFRTKAYYESELKKITLRNQEAQAEAYKCWEEVSEGVSSGVQVTMEREKILKKRARERHEEFLETNKKYRIMEDKLLNSPEIKLEKKRTGLTKKTLICFGLFCTFLSMVISFIQVGGVIFSPEGSESNWKEVATFTIGMVSLVGFSIAIFDVFLEIKEYKKLVLQVEEIITEEIMTE